jgi:colanic acid/amylovoran biosynthesis glycosyltransferase
MKMKIAFIVGAFPKLSETFILNQLTGLMDAGHDVQVFAKFDPKQSHVHSDVAKYRLTQRVHYPPAMGANKIIARLKSLFMILWSGLQRPVATYNVVKEQLTTSQGFSHKRLYTSLFYIRKRFDIVHCHFGANGDLGVYFKKIDPAVKLISMFHGTDILLGIEKGEGFYRELFAAADMVMANSSFTRENLLEQGSDPDKTIIHHVGIDLNRFVRPDHPSRNRDASDIVIITVARLVEEKALEYAITAFAKVRENHPELNLTYRLIGSGHLEDQLRKLVDELKVEGSVIFCGPADHDQVVAAMSQADIFLLSSIFEGFGLVLVEAQAMGLPIVTTAVGGTPQAVDQDKSALLVPSRDSDAIAEKLEYLIDHRECWPEMGRCGREFVEKNYDIAALNERLIQLYRDLLEGRS